ncbi:hypothetical protein N7E02_03850 (plasmid) [Aliirhizobium terrae]|uniref:hypothetical protein n=1 Tax=Terrirhizobium terrae TaxID=2926709 RepID=UPI002577D788|nr:hypothetical protein [Rhizobium sp. CC-CFT758]WJH38550.1 hypothetical protein N7E02_03850 [Rhizobium sp. CC-CFT758]
MPTDIDLKTWLPEEGLPEENNGDGEKVVSPSATRKGRGDRHDEVTTKRSVVTNADVVRRKRISLYLDDDVLMKIFRVSLEQHEQLSAATHRLILEALKARGF